MVTGNSELELALSWELLIEFLKPKIIHIGHERASKFKGVLSVHSISELKITKERRNTEDIKIKGAVLQAMQESVSQSQIRFDTVTVQSRSPPLQ